MIKVKEIVQQLSHDTYRAVECSLSESRAQKLLCLLQAYRNSCQTDDQIAASLDMSLDALYVMKSRLNDRIRSALAGDMFSSREEILKRLQQVPEVCITENRAVAIAYLQKLESELLQFDMHAELLTVYSALKKMHFHSGRYFHYSQLFNRHVAFHLALEKCEDCLISFNNILAEFDFSRSEAALEKMLFLRDEIANHFALNPSRQAMIIQNIVLLQLHVFAGQPLPDPEAVLAQTLSHIEELPDTASYKSWTVAIRFIAFAYYESVGHAAQTSAYLSLLHHDLGCMLLSSHIAITPRLLRMLPLHECSTMIVSGTEIKYESSHTYSSVNLGIYRAMTSFAAGDAREAAHHVNSILAAYSFKNLVHIDIELKLTLGFFYIRLGDADLATSVLRSASRKLGKGAFEYPNVQDLIRLFNMELRGGKAADRRRMHDQFLLFVAKNKGRHRVLQHLVPYLTTHYQV